MVATPVAELQELEVVLRDSTAAADFSSLRDGREVYLCWQDGEDAIGFWHEPEAGFAGRSPSTAELRAAPSAPPGLNASSAAPLPRVADPERVWLVLLRGGRLRAARRRGARPADGAGGGYALPPVARRRHRDRRRGHLGGRADRGRPARPGRGSERFAAAGAVLLFLSGARERAKRPADDVPEDAPGSTPIRRRRPRVGPARPPRWTRPRSRFPARVQALRARGGEQLRLAPDDREDSQA